MNELAGGIRKFTEKELRIKGNYHELGQLKGSLMPLEKMKFFFFFKNLSNASEVLHRVGIKILWAKQPKCPSTDEWIKKMWHIYTMEYYSAMKRNEIELFVVRWIDLESVIQSEVSQKEKNKYHMLRHIYGI